MKKLVLFAAALAAASTVMAQTTNQVLSRNAVGYESFNITTNQYALVRYDFNYMGAGLTTVSNLIGNQLPRNSQVFLWDGAAQQYVIESKGISGWTPNTNIIDYGEAFFVKCSANNISNNYITVYLMGEVPDAFTSPAKTSAVYGATGGAYGLYAYAYPVQTPFINTHFYSNSVRNDQLFMWNMGNQQYDIYSRGISGWSAGTTNVQIKPGEGFFYKTTNTAPWVMVKPYTWP